MPSLIRSLLRSVASFALLLAVAAPLGAQAAAKVQCECWCGKAGVGAQLLDGAAKMQDDPSACATACRGASLRLVGCFTSSANTPPKDDKCWDQAQCTSQGAGYEYASGQFDCPPNMGYCYAPPKVAITLNASISGVSQISTLPEYVALVYRTLIGVGALLSVIMIVIAGFQWLSSRGNSGQVGKAKERIEAVVVGMILLLGAYVIARVIDPRLVTGNPLRVPQLKSIELLDGITSCEKLIEYKYEVEQLDDSRDCGMRGRVTSTENVASDVQSNIQVGATCQFTGCGDPTETCVSANGQARCTTCEGVTADMGYAETALDMGGTIAPLCKGVESQAKAQDPSIDHIYACVYETANTFNGCIEIANKQNYIDCAAMRTAAAGMGTSACGLYTTLFTKTRQERGSNTLTRVADLCMNDRCIIAPEAGISGCTMSEEFSYLEAALAAAKGFAAGAAGGQVFGAPGAAAGALYGGLSVDPYQAKCIAK